MAVEHFRASDGTSIGYRTYGAGPRVVTALHSLSLDGSWYEPMAEALGEEYLLVCPDVRGHGASEAGLTALSLGRVANDVIELWNHLGVEQSAVLGVSMGGMIAQALSSVAGPRVAALVLIATGGAFDAGAREGALARVASLRASDDMSTLVGPLLERWFGVGVDRDIPLVARAAATLAATSPRIQADALEAMLEIGSFDAAPHQPPTLVIGGTDDLGSTPAVLEALAAKHPGSRLVFMPGPHLFAFTRVGPVAAEIAVFLDEHQPQPASA